MSLKFTCLLKKHLQLSILSLILRIVMGILFIFSGVVKIFHLHEFIITVTNYKILPEFFVPYFALCLPILEYILGFFLIFRVYVYYVSRILFFLVVTFIIAILINIGRNNLVECGCFGYFFSDIIGWKTLIRDLFILAALFYLSLNPKKKHTSLKSKQ